MGQGVAWPSLCGHDDRGLHQHCRRDAPHSRRMHRRRHHASARRLHTGSIPSGDHHMSNNGSAYNRARELKQPTYTGRPCTRCGSTIRMTNTCACQGCDDIRKSRKLTPQEQRRVDSADRQLAGTRRNWREALSDANYAADDLPDKWPYNATSRPPLAECNTGINQWPL